MADPITAEQVARAIEAARSDEGGISDALGGWQWDKRAPDYVRVAWGKPSLPDFIAALTRWHAELVAAETPRKAPDDTAPERLRERRERADAAQAARMQRDAADYAAALSAEEERRGAQLLADEEARAEAFHAEPERVVTGPLSAGRDRAIQVTHLTSGYIHADGLPWADWQIEPAAPPAPDVVDVPQPDPLAYADSPAWDDGPMPKPERAPEVVDVPQPETWHARLVRLATEAQAAGKACAEAEAAFTQADADREKARLARAAAREMCHAKRQALTEATAAASIIRDAQQGGAS